MKREIDCTSAASVWKKNTPKSQKSALGTINTKCERNKEFERKKPTVSVYETRRLISMCLHTSKNGQIWN